MGLKKTKNKLLGGKILLPFSWLGLTDTTKVKNWDHSGYIVFIESVAPSTITYFIYLSDDFPVELDTQVKIFAYEETAGERKIVASLGYDIVGSTEILNASQSALLTTAMAAYNFTIAGGTLTANKLLVLTLTLDAQPNHYIDIGGVFFMSTSTAFKKCKNIQIGGKKSIDVQYLGILDDAKGNYADHTAFIYWLIGAGNTSIFFSFYLPDDFPVDRATRIRVYVYEESVGVRKLVLSLGYDVVGSVDIINATQTAVLATATTAYDFTINAGLLTAGRLYVITLTLNGDQTHCVDLSGVNFFTDT